MLFDQKKKKKRNKGRIIRDIRNLFEHDEDHYKPVILGNFQNNNNIEFKAKAIEKHYQLKNILIKLDNA